MRTINPKNFHLATRATSREINRQIALNLIRTHQPISRADLARQMNTRRGAVSLIVNELLAEGLIREGATGETQRGRKPTFLYIDTRERFVIAVDIRVTRTYVTASDLLGRPIVGIASFPTRRDVPALIADIARHIADIRDSQLSHGTCEGVGVVVPGMVELTTGRVIHAPTLGWRDVSLRDPLSAAVGVPVQIENSGRACALAQVWATRGEAPNAGDVAYVNISDGVGVGIVVNGELLRGRNNIAGEFGHVPLSIDGPRCSCGATGCWEAYVSNLATLSRYFGRDMRTIDAPVPSETATFTVSDLISRARGGDAKAVTALQATARYLGLGLASIVNAVDPVRIYLGGEITGAWDLIETAVKAALAERALTAQSSKIDIVIVSVNENPRLRGAAALIAAPAFAAPKVA